MGWMKIQLLHLDGKLPNIALMRLSAWHKANGDEVEMRRTPDPENDLFGGMSMPHKVYGSAIFRSTIPSAERAVKVFPGARIGGTGVDPARKGELVPFSPVISPATTDHGLGEGTLDYSLYPHFNSSIGFTQRGCRLKCEFCVVPVKEGRVRSTGTVADLWRGDPWPRELHLLDNDFFGQPDWRGRIREIRDGKFKVCFNQGINARCLTEESAEAIASVNYRDDQMKDKRIYTAWDNRADEERLFAGLNRLVKYGVRPDHIMVYILVGFWPGETSEDREYRRKKLRDFGARPYPMAYITSQTAPDLARELRGFQRWIIRRADVGKNACPWEDFVAANYRPERVGMQERLLGQHWE